MSDYTDEVQRVIDEIVVPQAVSVDREGRFPRHAITALGQAGVLGLTVPAAAGGGGQGLAEAAEVIRRLSGACGSTAMVVLMHYAATAVIVNHGPEDVQKAIGAGQHLTTLAFSEAGSRSHFWAPQGRAMRSGAAVQLDAKKSWVTAAGEADSYVWSSRPLEAEGPMTLWLVPSDAAGLAPPGDFDGLGLRGNASRPIQASGVVVP
ncbi:MAG: acyl-CoA dehydrogenase family protein, partial [Acidimicrobiia bacterium]|nr:acyl-CoA dehydrogenase family protein [Acidimicrobiia bacterium]